MAIDSFPYITHNIYTSFAHGIKWGKRVLLKTQKSRKHEPPQGLVESLEEFALFDFFYIVFD